MACIATDLPYSKSEQWYNFTLIAALAHEFGHIFWYDVLVSPRNTLPVSSRFCNGILTDYMEGSNKIPFWNGTLLQSGVWRDFKDIDNNPGSIPDIISDPPGLGDPDPSKAKVVYMESALRNGSVSQARATLRRILAEGRPFPSLLGAYSATEQFVESFTLYTLMHVPLNPLIGTGPLMSLPLQIRQGSGPPVDIPSDLLQGKRRRLGSVLGCFDNLVPNG